MKTQQELAEDIIAFHERRLARLKQLKQISCKRKRKGRLNKEIEALEAHIAEISKWKAVT